MNDLTPAHEAIQELRKAITQARLQLAGLVLGVCPGPHRPVQHRDHNQPWCTVCGYATDGERVSDAQVSNTPSPRG